MKHILLHTCCAPCSSAILEWMLREGLTPVVFYSNSNIHPKSEYDHRRDECRRWCAQLGVRMVEDVYDHDEWRGCAAVGREDEPERGSRCLECFKYRLARAARYASENGFDLLTTTLASSRWKSLDQIDEAGRWACSQVGGVEWWGRNWRKDGLQERRNQLIREMNFYNQQYCGCEYSLADPKQTGRRIVERFLSTPPEDYADGTFIMYAVSSLWMNALRFAKLTSDKALQTRLTDLLKPYMAEKRDKCRRMNHVDFSVFGGVPLEAFTITGDKAMLEFGLRYADHQWEAPDPDDLGDTGNADLDTQMGYLKDGYSPQSRFWIEDMYMITALQTQAYLATGDIRYIERTARQMAEYLSEMQLEGGLFNHCAAAPHKWGRGNGWVAGGMPLLLKYLPEGNEYRPLIETSFRRMMSTLLKYQHDSGLWGQIIDEPGAWDESSCSAMFTSAFFAGMNQGLLDRDVYGPAARKAWVALCSKLDSDGNIADVGAGINANPDKQAYLNHPKINGAPHGQAAMLWTVNEMLK